MPKNILVVWSLATHKIAANNIAQWFQSKSMTVSFVQIQARESLTPFMEEIQFADIIIVSAGGRLLNRIIDFVEIHDLSSFIISNFPGIVSPLQIEAFITRVRADLVLLNNSTDASTFKQVCRAMQIENKGIEIGPSWLSAPMKNSFNAKSWIFAEQDLIPAPEYQLKLLALDLCGIAAKNPDRKVKIRPHPRVGHSRLEPHFLGTCIPKNLTIDTSENIDWENTEGILSLSSSLILDAIHSNRKAIILSGYEVPEEQTLYYRDSNIIQSAAQTSLSAPPTLSRNWRDKKIADFQNNIDQLSNYTNRKRTQTRIASSKACRIRLIAYFPHRFCLSQKEFRQKINQAFEIIGIL